MKLFDFKMMKYIDEKLDWKQVIHEGVKLLVDNNKATWELKEKIFEVTKKYGAYYVLERGLALLHAPAGVYAKQAAISTLILKDEVCFNNQDDKCAKIILTLSAPNNLQHISLIQQFGQWFMDENFKNKAFSVNSLEEFLQLIKEKENEN
ncbi:PTS sugar transporter subunit IIA [Mesomycoplasma neurolyticum]|uniref:Ascorbate-specific PTS system EIIA component n=1 Tax=Mesomycoplasma neurolyticum TaxID=2120 RepID=A0A449A553_9BACT|nr:PTS sugar transporter subunit IIA [Mesomycoplasma neurolyticum]VEU59352.1 ascorbate-specific PTS system enzyme II Ccomponent [Mesomycoplasma neurolyticum]